MSETILTNIALPVTIFVLSIMVGAVGFFLKRIAIQMDENCHQIIKIEAMFVDMSNSLKYLRKDLSTLWSTLIKN